jgi:hypothetical protein
MLETGMYSQDTIWTTSLHLKFRVVDSDNTLVAKVDFPNSKTPDRSNRTFSR